MAKTQKQRRGLLIKGGQLALLGAGGLSAWIQNVLALGVVYLPAGIYKLQGDVQINGRPAREGSPVRAGDTVRTGPGAQAIYVIGKDAFLQRGDSAVRFGNDASKDFLRVISGRLLSVFGSGQKTLLTPTATMGIRGTGCYIEAQETEVYFCLCYGRVNLVPLADPSQATEIETTHHDHPLKIYRGSGMPVMVDASVINHTDAELIMLETLTGRRPPFVRADGTGPRY